MKASPFKPVRRVRHDETDQLTYEPAANLTAAFRAVQKANDRCRAKPSFANVADACRKCRTMFAEFIGEALTAGASVRLTMLPRVQALLEDCREVVTDAMPHITEDEESELASGYLEHIGDRIRLSTALSEHALPGYLDEIASQLSKSAPKLAATH
jgi:hypothetical protein